jgi:feruloyl-CoA synthase
MSVSTRPRRSVQVASLGAIFDRRTDGVIYARSSKPLGNYPDRVTDVLEYWAARAPERVFLAERTASGGWRTVTYQEAYARVRKLAGGLVAAGLSADRPLAILSGNSIDHGLLALAAMHVGIPYVPVAPAYSLAVKEYVALTHLWRNLSPAMVFVEDGQAFGRALEAVATKETKVVYGIRPSEKMPGISLAELENSASCPAVEAASRRVRPESVAKILYTSGSTGMPKGVITTHRMLCSNQQMLREVLEFLGEEPPVLCDWLPWNHTFGGSHNFGIVLYNGGSLYIDGGKPTEEMFRETIRNLREIPTTAHFNVPKAYELLVMHLRSDKALRETFFSRLRILFFAAAGLSQRIWDDLQDLAFETCGEEILVVTGLGATETAPFALSTGIGGARAGHLGLPVPGVELKLVPVEEKVEARLRGPSITPGYWRREDLSARAFDEEGFYCLGDAVKFLDPDDWGKGFVFDGRLNEDFKLASGTWVRVGALRMRVLAHFECLLQDVVIAAPDRDYTAALLFPAWEACRKLCLDLPADAPIASILAHPSVRAAFKERLVSFARLSTGSSTRIDRAILLDTPPSIEAQEITDKGTINQKAVLRNRATLVEEMYKDPAPQHVWTVLETTP